MADQSNEMGMVTKVAAAQFKVFSAGRLLENYPDHAPIWNDIARAAIEALKEPSNEMRRAFWKAEDPTDAGFRASWNAALDAALSRDEVKA